MAVKELKEKILDAMTMNTMASPAAKIPQDDTAAGQLSTVVQFLEALESVSRDERLTKIYDLNQATDVCDAFVTTGITNAYRMERDTVQQFIDSCSFDRDDENKRVQLNWNDPVRSHLDENILKPARQEVRDQLAEYQISAQLKSTALSEAYQYLKNNVIDPSILDQSQGFRYADYNRFCEDLNAVYTIRRNFESLLKTYAEQGCLNAGSDAGVQEVVNELNREEVAARTGVDLRIDNSTGAVIGERRDPELMVLGHPEDSTDTLKSLGWGTQELKDVPVKVSDLEDFGSLKELFDTEQAPDVEAIRSSFEQMLDYSCATTAVLQLLDSYEVQLNRLERHALQLYHLALTNVKEEE